MPLIMVLGLRSPRTQENARTANCSFRIHDHALRLMQNEDSPYGVDLGIVELKNP